MSGRSETYRRNPALEALLDELNGVLDQAERQVALPEEPTRPQLLVVGPPRSGTTLLMQWLAASGAIAYPTNLLARFYRAPYLGARIQQLLTDPRFNFRDELWAFAEYRESFSSELGKTRGPLEPNEFWYFWRRFLPLTEPEPLGEERRTAVDRAGLRRGLAALEAAFERPFAAKGILFQYDIPLIAEILPRAVFLYTVRDRETNASSLLNARVSYWGDASRWYSVRPPGSERLAGATPEVQVAGQILATHRALGSDLAGLPRHRVLHVDYEAFCADPGACWGALRERLAVLGEELPAAAPDCGAFRASPALPLKERTRWSRAFEEADALLT